jgi:hypothetical protein
MAGKALPKPPAPAPLAPGLTVALLAAAVVVVVIYLANRRVDPPDGGLYVVPDEPDEGGNDGIEQLEQIG